MTAMVWSVFSQLVHALSSSPLAFALALLQFPQLAVAGESHDAYRSEPLCHSEKKCVCVCVGGGGGGLGKGKGYAAGPGGGGEE